MGSPENGTAYFRNKEKCKLESAGVTIFCLKIFNELNEYAENTSHIESVLIVGSYDRGTNKENLDLDIVIITSNKLEMITNQDFTQDFGEVYKQQIKYYGNCTSIRVWYKNGKEAVENIKLGFE